MKDDKRSREGCWTCRRRKKKCDGRKPSCANCERIKVQFKGYSSKILWEDDSIRESMRRRGSPKTKGRSGDTTFATGSTFTIHVNDAINEASTESCNIYHPHSVQELYESLIYGPRHHSQMCSPPPHPLALTAAQSLFLDNYINHFSLAYPTFSDSTNPFLSIFTPLALSNNTVLYAVLALSATQTALDSQMDIRAEALSLKGRALKGCRTLLKSLTGWIRLNNVTEKSDVCNGSSSTDIYHGTIEWDDSGDDLALIASVMLLVLSHKLAGETYSTLIPHLNFARFLLSRRFLQDGSKVPPSTSASPHRSPFAKRPHSQHLSSQYKFLYNLFRYNDLLAALASAPTSPQPHTHPPTTHLPPSAQETEPPLPTCKFFYPNLLSTLAAQSPYNTHDLTLHTIDTWDGMLNFLPSFTFVAHPSRSYPFCGAGNTGQTTLSYLRSTGMPPRFTISVGREAGFCKQRRRM